MKLRHPIDGSTYERRDDGLVRVEEEGGRSGLFHPDGRCHSGELRDVDIHFLNWVGGPQLQVRGQISGSRRQTAERAAGPGHAGRHPGAASKTPNEQRRSTGMDLGLGGMKALVTAASRGIGLCIAQTLADEGADVAICARGDAALETARKDLEGRGARVFARTVDVSDGDALKAFVTEATESLSGLDIVVSNASAGSAQGEKGWQANFDVDMMGSARLLDAARPALAESEAGSAVLISSTAAVEFLGVPQPYNAMKAALIAFANDQSQAMARQGVRVNVVSPGPIYFEGGNWEMIKQTMPQIYERTLAQCALGRMGTPEEVARAVVFLASPAASLITGTNLVVDGGFTKRAQF